MSGDRSLVLIRWTRQQKGLGGPDGERVLLEQYAPLLRFLREGGHPDTTVLQRRPDSIDLEIVVRRKFAEMVYGIVERRFGPLTHAVTVSGPDSPEPLLQRSAEAYRTGTDLTTRIGIELLEVRSHHEARERLRALPDLLEAQEETGRILSHHSHTFRRTPPDVFWPLMGRRSPDGTVRCIDALRSLVVGVS